jgi:hypothetical protein
MPAQAADRGRSTEEVTTMPTTRQRTVAALIAGLALGSAACGSNGGAAAGDAAAPDVTPATTQASAATTTTAAATTTVATVPPTTVDDEEWRQQVDRSCAAAAPVAALPAPAPDRASLEARVKALREYRDASRPVIGLPPGPGRTRSDMDAAWASAGATLDRFAAAAAAGDVETALREEDSYVRHLGFFASAYAAAGQSCGPADAGRAAEASLNVSMLSPWQVEVGYGSVWVSQSVLPTVVRVDAETGEVLATIEMPSRAFKLQPADGRMIVRTVDSYEAIDAETNTVVGSRLKADVGPAAGGSWAVDGALWICDGRRLHRYDPTTLEPMAVVELDHECGQVRATSDVAIAWTFNQDAGESGDSRATFVDPAANAVTGTVQLAGDSSVPIVLDDAVFFPPQFGSTATVVDRAALTVTATPDLGRPIDGGSQGAFDGTNIYVIADKPTGTIAVIDPVTFAVTGEVKALATAPSLNSLAATPGVLWAVVNSGGVLQRFDRKP